MTGAIAGARGGLAAVPDGLARRLNDRGTWTYDELVEADGMFARLCRVREDVLWSSGDVR